MFDHKAWYLENKETLLKQWRVRRDERLSLITSFKQKPCADCGHQYPSVAMDFDHVRGQKLFSLAHFNNRSVEAILLEVAKCDVVCANCHRIRTEGRRING